MSNQANSLSSLRRISQVALLLGALAAGSVRAQEVKKEIPEEPNEYHTCVVRAWVEANGQTAVKTGTMQTSFSVGDVLTVEVKNFNGWVVEKTDAIGYVEEELSRGLKDPIKNLIQNGLLRKAGDAAMIMNEAAKGELTEEGAEEYGMVNVLQEADIECIHNAGVAEKKRLDARKAAPPGAAGAYDTQKREPLAPGEPLPKQAVVEAVLNMPAFQVLKKPLSAGLDHEATPDELVATLAQDLNVFTQKLKAKKAAECRLRIDDLDLEGIAMDNPGDEGQPLSVRPRKYGYDDYFWFRFSLVDNETNAAVWTQLRKQIPLSRNVRLTINCPFGETHFLMQSAIEKLASGEKARKGFSQAKLVLIAGWQMGLAFVVLAFAIYIFSECAVRTDLIRDPQGGLRADGVLPFSLARSQMAFWFFLVVSAFLFLWVSLGKVPVLNDTCLWLIGIGAGTALGSAIISDDRTGNQTVKRAGPLTRRASEKRSAFATKLKAALDEVIAKIRAANDDDKPALELQKAVLEKQLDDYNAQPISGMQRLLDDWLTDDSSYSFHRYQMLIWTVVLGAVFIVSVAHTRTLPTFDGTLLALLGITNGTYLGFRLPSARKE